MACIYLDDVVIPLSFRSDIKVKGKVLVVCPGDFPKAQVCVETPEGSMICTKIDDLSKIEKLKGFMRTEIIPEKGCIIMFRKGDSIQIIEFNDITSEEEIPIEVLSEILRESAKVEEL